MYFDTSALIKHYIVEAGSEDVHDWMDSAEMSATSLVTRAEIAAGLTRLLRMNFLTTPDYAIALDHFRADWLFYQRIPISEELVARADRLACEFGLRGYDAVHLAAALTWRENLGFSVTLATFDGQLAGAGRQSGLAVLPE